MHLLEDVSGHENPKLSQSGERGRKTTFGKKRHRFFRIYLFIVLKDFLKDSQSKTLTFPNHVSLFSI